MIYVNWMDVLMLRAQLYRAIQLKTEIQARAERLILSPGHFVVQTISSLWPTRATVHCAQSSSERTYSLIVLTNTRFRRRPSRLPGQPFCLA